MAVLQKFASSLPCMAPAILHMTDTVQYSTANQRWRHSANNKESARHHLFEDTCKEKKMATLNEQRKKRARLGFRYTMELNFASEDSKNIYLPP